MLEILQTLQNEQAVWSEKNFGEQPPTAPLLGLIEEVGELAHAVLKRNQGIRTGENHIEQMKDAIGDIVIYAADYATRQGFQLDAAYGLLVGFEDMRNFRDDAGTDAFVFSISLSLGRLCKYHSARVNLGKAETIELQTSYMGALLVQLKRLCDREDLRLDKIIEETWAQVKRRDWKKYPETGLPKGKAA